MFLWIDGFLLKIGIRVVWMKVFFIRLVLFIVNFMIWKVCCVVILVMLVKDV